MIYCYTVTKDNIHFLLRKSKTLDGIRKMAYQDLHQKWIFDKKAGDSNIYIEKHSCDNAKMDGDVLINPKTGNVLIGSIVGCAYTDHGYLYHPEGSNRVYDLLPNGKLGRIDRYLGA